MIRRITLPFVFASLALLYVLSVATPASAMSATKVNWHFWGRGIGILDVSSTLGQSVCDSNSVGILPLSGGSLDTGPCHASNGPNSNFLNSQTNGNVRYANTCPVSFVPPVGQSCSFLQLVLTDVYARETVKTYHGQRNGYVTVNGEGTSELDIWKTTITTPGVKAVLRVSVSADQTTPTSCSGIPFGSGFKGTNCVITLTEDGTSQSNLSWSTPNISGIVFSPANGILSPGGTQLVTISILPTATCAPQTLPFNVQGDGSASLQLTCDNNNKGTISGNSASDPVIAGQTTSTTTFVRPLLATNDIITKGQATCILNNSNHTRANVLAQTTIGNNDLRVLSSGAFDVVSPDGEANQTVSIPTGNANFVVQLVINEQKQLVDGNFGWIKFSGVHYIVLDSQGVVRADFSVAYGLAGIHCSHDLPHSEQLIA